MGDFLAGLFPASFLVYMAVAAVMVLGLRVLVPHTQVAGWRIGVAAVFVLAIIISMVTQGDVSWAN